MVKNTIDKVFENCKAVDRSALIMFVEVGYPTLESSYNMIEVAIQNGANIIELGVPFSDPTADGGVISGAAQVAVANKVNLNDVLDIAKRIKSNYPDVGMVLFSYMNIMFQYGLENLCQELKNIGVDGILGVDLPIEEQDELLIPCNNNNLHLISLVTPSTSEARIKEIAKTASGFIYYVSVSGVTGERSELPADLVDRLKLTKSCSNDVPIALGFGISNGKMAKTFAPVADGIIVGSAYVKLGEDLDKAGKLVADLSNNMAKN